MDDKGTPERDHQDNDAFEKSPDAAVSDQSGETGPPSADEPKDGEDD